MVQIFKEREGGLEVKWFEGSSLGLGVRTVRIITAARVLVEFGRLRGMERSAGGRGFVFFG
jgi:hypothetical protein